MSSIRNPIVDRVEEPKKSIVHCPLTIRTIHKSPRHHIELEIKLQAVPDEVVDEVGKMVPSHSLTTWNMLKHRLSRPSDVVDLNWQPA